jgi:glutathione S-transferase
MIQLYKFAPAWGLPTPSSFALKVEAYLRLTGLPYEPVHVQRPMDSPKKTVPWIRDGEMLLADSGFILEYLKEKHGDPLGAGLSAGERALSHALRRMVEENLARIIGYTRWLTEENWPATREVGFGAMAEPWKTQISGKAREKIREDMILHGIGRHTPAEVQHIGLLDVQAIETLLGGRPYLLGAGPREVDCAVFGVLAQFVVPPLQCAISDHARASAPISEYVYRMLERCFPSAAS